VVLMVQTLAKHIEQLVALPDELRETCIRKFRKFCESCGCNIERELVSALAEEGRPRASLRSMVQDQALSTGRWGHSPRPEAFVDCEARIFSLAVKF
jgi:hypothetical protein